MGKAGKWIKSFLIGAKKDKDKEKHNSTSHPSPVTENPTTPVVISPATPKEKKRWSFRRSSATAPGPKDPNSDEPTPTKPAPPASPEPPESQHKKPESAAANSEVTTVDPANHVEEAAATKIQSVFRSYLARKALRALRGLVKLQALVRGHLVRKQATATLRCIQALVSAQARARARRIRSVEEGKLHSTHRHSTHRKNGHQHYNFSNSYHEVEKAMMEENIKIVEMDMGESKGSSKTRNTYSNYTKQDHHKISPEPSAITDTSPRACSGHFEDYSFATAQTSPQCHYPAAPKPDPSRMPFAFASQAHAAPMSYEYPLYPNYMANTQSSKSKARSQSAPKQRPDCFERQPSRRRPSVEGRNIPRAVRMQRSSSHVGAAAQSYQYPWSMRLDQSTISLKDSECGSTCSVVTNTNYCRSVVSYDVSVKNYTKDIQKD